MKVELEAFAAARQKLGFPRIMLDLPDGATIESVVALLAVDHPAAARVLGVSRYALDGEYAERDALLHDGAVLSVIPPVSGGAPLGGPPRAIVSTDPISLDEALRAVASPSAGAVVFFVGTVRDRNRNAVVRYIEYESKTDMAARELERLIETARAQFIITEAFIRHRIGKISVGEASVVIAVAAAHRDAAYQANQWMLEELKKNVPIWKNESRFVDGRVEEVWLGMGGG